SPRSGQVGKHARACASPGPLVWSLEEAGKAESRPCLPCCRGPGDVSDLAATDFHVASCQATLFTPEEAVSAVKLIKGLLPSWVSRFDQEPMVLPFGGEVPRAIPRSILQSTDGARRCAIASELINLL